MTKAGIIKKVKFTQSGSSSFGSFIEYIDREDAVFKKNLEKYNLFADYMGNPEKSTGLFSENGYLSDKEKKELKKIFKNAEDNGSCLIQEVFSFDTEWIKEHGIVEEDGFIKEETLMNYSISAINKMLSVEKFNSAIWTAAIHHNTEHVHIHVAIIDNDVTWEPGKGRCTLDKNGKPRQKGMLSKKALNAGASDLANSILDNKEINSKITDIIRSNIITPIKENFTLDNIEPEVQNKINILLNNLPEDRRLWKYNNNALKDIRPLIDDITSFLIENYYKDDYQELNHLLDKNQEAYTVVYGQNSNNNYKENKIDDLYSRVGNAILNQCKIIAKQDSFKNYRTPTKKKYYYNSAKNRYYYNSDLHEGINYIKRACYNDISHLKNQAAYEQLMMDRNI